MMREGRYAEAEQILIRFARELPHHDHGMVWYELSEVFEQKGDTAHADFAYRKALECEWSSIYALAYGDFLWRVGRAVEAVKLFRKLERSLDPSPYPVAPIINAIEEGIPYESFWERRWPPGES